MRRRFSQVAAAYCATLTLTCAMGREEPLPDVRLPALFDLPQMCVPVPPPPPIWEPYESPVDPRSCLSVSAGPQRLPVEVRVLNGRVSTFEFYEQCGGGVGNIEVDAAVRECIRASLATWRYPVWPVCPGQDSESRDQLYLTPLRPLAARTASAVIPRGCGG
jgi:hypothetical protein